MRLNEYQKSVLELQFQLNPVWSTDRIKLLSKELGLEHRRVYKWRWDRVKKQLRQESHSSTRITGLTDN